MSARSGRNFSRGCGWDLRRLSYRDSSCFQGDAADFYLASVFRIKIAVILLAVIFGIIVQWGARKWGQLPTVPVSAKILAFVSLVLWIGAILASVEVPAISGVG